MHASVETMVNVQVKRVPPEWHATLKARAAARGISLNDLLLELLERETSLPSLEEWGREVRALNERHPVTDEVRRALGDQAFWDEVKDRWSEPS